MFVKPGANANGDVRDGLAEDCTFDNMTLLDPTGERFERGLIVSAARGAICRRIKGTDLKGSARGHSNTGLPLIGGADIRLLNLGAATIEDVDVQIEYSDPYDGKLGGTCKLNFTSGGTYVVALGNQITGATSGATVTISKEVLTGGSWAAGTAAGYFLLLKQVGTLEPKT